MVSSLLSRVSFFSPFVMSFIVEFLRETISRQFVSHDVADKDFVERTKRLQAKGKEMYVLCCFLLVIDLAWFGLGLGLGCLYIYIFS